MELFSRRDEWGFHWLTGDVWADSLLEAGPFRVGSHSKEMALWGWNWGLHLPPWQSSAQIFSLLAVAFCWFLCLIGARVALELANAFGELCTIRLTSLQLTLLQDVGLSIFVTSSNTARPLQALGCCYLFSLYSPHSKLTDILMRNNSSKCELTAACYPVPRVAAYEVPLPWLFPHAFTGLFFYTLSHFYSCSQAEGLFWYYLFHHSW